MRAVQHSFSKKKEQRPDEPQRSDVSMNSWASLQADENENKSSYATNEQQVH